MAHAAAPKQITIDPSQLKTLATGLGGTEGPSVLPDGSVALVEPMGGAVVRVNTDGTRDVLTTTGMGVAGTALGRDNALYIAKINPGGFLKRPPSGAPGAPGASPGGPGSNRQ